MIKTTEIFDEWLVAQDDVDRENVLASLIVLRARGPDLPRPYADTVYGSRHRNMKELRVQSKGNPIRVFFAFDPKREGILLCAGNKVGKEKRFYDVMISLADAEFARYLDELNKKE